MTVLEFTMWTILALYSPRPTYLSASVSGVLRLKACSVKLSNMSFPLSPTPHSGVTTIKGWLSMSPACFQCTQRWTHRHSLLPVHTAMDPQASPPIQGSPFPWLVVCPMLSCDEVLSLSSFGSIFLFDLYLPAVTYLTGPPPPRHDDTQHHRVPRVPSHRS